MFFDTESRTQETRVQSNIMYKVYAWMASGLAVTGLTAYGLYMNLPIFLAIIKSAWIFYGMLFSTVIIAIIVGVFAERLSYATIITLFFAYATLLGATVMAAVLIVYKPESLALIFGITAGMFGLCALYGYFTNSDLSKMGSILIMALLGIIIAGLINMFLHSSTFNYILSFISVIIFSGLTAYQVQNIKQLEWQCGGDQYLIKKFSILGAFTLYLSFINLFLSLLDLFGQRKER